jgi:hypothetical protein
MFYFWLPMIAHQILSPLPGRFLVDFCVSCDPYFVLEIFELKKKPKKQKKKNH